MPPVPRVSIVIPMYNSARYLSATLDSIRGQTMPDFELVLLDDGSADATCSIAREYAARDARIRLILGQHEGIAAARNRGFAATNPGSEFVTFFDHDDVWEPAALQTLVSALEANPGCVGAHGVAQCILGTGERYALDDLPEKTRNRLAVVGDRVERLPVSAPTTFGAVLIENYMNTPGTSLVRRRVLEDVGGFEPSSVPCDDWDMNLRISRRGDYVFVDRIVINWRRHPEAASYLSNRWRSAYITARLRSIQSSENTPAQRQAALIAFRHHVGYLGGQARDDIMQGKFSMGARKLARSVLFYATYRRAQRSPVASR